MPTRSDPMREPLDTRGAPPGHDGHDGLDAAMRAVHAGSEEALRQMILLWRHRLHDLAFRLVRDRAAAAGVVQAVFVAVWQKRAQYAPTRPAWPWIARILRNQCYAWWRAKGSRRCTGFELTEEIELAGDVACPQPDPAVRAQINDLVAFAKERLRELPPRARAVLQLWLFDGFSEQRIARELSLPIGTVKSTKHRALRRLRDQIATQRRESTP